MKARKYKKIISTVALAFLIALIVGVFIILNSKAVLVRFDLKAITNTYTKFNLKFDRVKGASKYHIEIFDSNNYKVYEEDAKTNNVDMILTNLNNREEYNVVVKAISKTGEERYANNSLIFTYYAPYFSDEEVMLNNENHDLTILGDMLDDYTLKVIKNNKEIINEELTDDIYVLDKSLYENEDVRLDAYIYAGDVEVDRISLFNNINPISDIEITNLNDGEIIEHDDLLIEFKGGDNAEYYQVKAYNSNNKPFVNIITKNHSFVISKDLFDLNQDIRLEITGIRGDFNKQVNMNLHVKGQDKLKPVYISKDPDNILKNSKVELYNVEGSTIYYTLDGTTPNRSSYTYTEPLIINKNVTLKTFAVKDGFEDSSISTFKLKINEKNKLKVYISASNQSNNVGVESSDYTNEAEEMSEIADLIKSKLKKYDVEVKINNPNGNANNWNQEAKGYDLKISLQTDISTNSSLYGIETWIDSSSSNVYSIANNIQSSIVNIYPNKERENYNRGIKYSKCILSEACDKYHPNQMIVKLGYHDNLEDANWIHESKDSIATKIAQSILDYYGYIK
jgi:N-acetylmuramoyl-L-alanine amidase